MLTFKKYMTQTQGREPRTIDEIVVGFLELEEGCVREEAVIPPPDTCSDIVHYAYQASQWYLLTGLIILVFIGMIVELSWLAIKEKT